MARLPYVSREELPEDKRHIYDHIAESRGSVLNIQRMLLNSPDAAEAVSNLGEYIRYRSALDPAIRETAIITTAREIGSEYQWSHHEPEARKAGVRDEVIDSIRSGRAPMGLPAKEGVFAQAAKELVREGTLGDSTFQAILHLLGPSQTVDFVIVVGFYIMMGRFLKALEVELDEGKTARM